MTNKIVSDSGTVGVPTRDTREMLEMALKALEVANIELHNMWHQIDSEWGEGEGSLSDLISKGGEPEIAYVRKVITRLREFLA